MDHLKAIGLVLATVLGMALAIAFCYGFFWLFYFHIKIFGVLLGSILLFGMYRSMLNEVRGNGSPMSKSPGIE